MINQEYHIGDLVEVIMSPDKRRFEGLLDDWDDNAIYVNGLGFPWNDILFLNNLR